VSCCKKQRLEAKPLAGPAAASVRRRQLGPVVQAGADQHGHRRRSWRPVSRMCHASRPRSGVFAASSS